MSRIETDKDGHRVKQRMKTEVLLKIPVSVSPAFKAVFSTYMSYAPWSLGRLP